MEVRPAGIDDRSTIVEIYNHHVVRGRATFDVDPVTVEGRAPWFSRFAPTGRHRLLVAADRSGDGGGAVLGYACSGPAHSGCNYCSEIGGSRR